MILLILFMADHPQMTLNLLRTCTAPHVVVFYVFISLDSGGKQSRKTPLSKQTNM